MAPRAAIVALLALLLVSCASFDLVRPPERPADLYPSAETRGGVSIAVDVVSDPKRVERYFGANLLREGILPVQLIVSNHGDHRVSIQASDLLLLHGSQVVDPVPLERVAAIPKRRGLGITGETSRQINAFYQSISLRDAVLAPGQDYQGMTFFHTVSKERLRTRYFRVVSLFPRPTLWLRVAVTDLDARERIHFGPFGLFP